MPEPIGSSVPKFPSVAIEQLSANNHQSMALTCPAQSSPSPAFRWNLHHFFNIPALEPIGGSTPKFSSVAIEQISAYNHQSMALTCPAQSSPSPAFRWNLHHFYKIPALEPIGGSTPKFSSDATENILAHSDRTLSMACPAQASPVPTFRWSWPFKR